jgi:hypothetical protein
MMRVWCGQLLQLFATLERTAAIAAVVSTLSGGAHSRTQAVFL